MRIEKLLLIIGFVFGATSLFAQSSTEVTLRGDNELYAKNIISIYPQPATEYITVKIDNSTLEKVSFEMFNIIGVPVKIEAEKISDYEFRISVKDLSLGYYMLLVKDAPSRYQKAFKFLKK